MIELFEALRQPPNTKWTFVDGSIVKAHQHSAGAYTQDMEGISKSVTGNTTKIHRAVYSGGLPVEFDNTGGEVHYSKAASELIDKLPCTDYIISDKGYDCEPLRKQINAKKAIPVVPR